MKKLFSLLLAAVLLLSLVPAAFAARKYTDEELEKLAREYYRVKRNTAPPSYIDTYHSGYGTVSIQLYNMTPTHSLTFEWYFVDRYGKGRNMMEEPVDLSEVEYIIPDALDGSYASVIRAVEGTRYQGDYAEPTKGAVYDLNGDGVNELFLLYQPDPGRIGYSLYTKVNGVAVPIRENEVLADIYSSAGGLVGAVNVGGKCFFAVYSQNGGFDMDVLRSGEDGTWTFYTLEGTGLTPASTGSVVYYEGPFQLIKGTVDGRALSAEEFAAWRAATKPGPTVGYSMDDVGALSLEQLLSVADQPPLAYASTQTVQVDGQPVSFPMYALKDVYGNPTNYIKVRDLALALNGTAARFEVGWENGNVILTAGENYTANGSEMSTPFSGDRTYTAPGGATVVNGTARRLDAIYLTDDNGGGYTYYKLRDLGAALGFGVDWDQTAGVCVTTSPGR